MSVVVDATGTAQDSTTNVTTLAYTGITVGSGANRALVVFVSLSGGTFPSTPTAVWDSVGANQSMTLRTSLTEGNFLCATYLFVLRNPVSGNKTCTISWTGANNISACGISFTGVDQTSDTTAFPNPNTTGSTSGTTTHTLTITSATGNIPVAAITDAGIFSSNNQTQIYLDTNPVDDGGAQRAAGAASVSFTWTVTSSGNAFAYVGCDVAAASTDVLRAQIML